MSNNTAEQAKGRANKSVVIKSTVGVVVMFAFAVFVMPPLYDLFCEITGIGDKSADRYEQDVVSSIDESRTVRIKFVANNAATMPWDFGPKTFEVFVHPGEATEIEYFARNRTPRNMVAQAIPNISPTTANRYFLKTECFCFNQQPLEAGATADMKLVFIVDRDLPQAVNTITLSYSLFDVTDKFPNEFASLD